MSNTKRRGDQYVVDLDNHTCSCRKWDLLGIPVLMELLPYITKELWEKTKTTIKPPAYTRQPGRPRKGKGRPRKIPNQDPAVVAEEAKAVARARRKLAYARANAAAIAKKAALNAS
ncbi:unnamed protein product [Prunus armeniaca]|uniref:SWIM-type domain-containing protein n=1 Tax=Prunus armeniaca TaxID=36596 RepID=A0A6J5UP47_PRUAR|nr:unnamed protein product [Prunus armeniaca]CAB4308816.1 unnamed protein product [Prunus armeniaca]